MIIYICLSIICVIVSAIVFHPHLLLFPASTVPLALFIITIIEICLLKQNIKNIDSDEEQNNTTYSLNEIDYNALKSIRKHIYTIKSLSLPCFLIFVFFFISSKKILCSILIYLSTYICARLFAQIKRKIKNKK